MRNARSIFFTKKIAIVTDTRQDSFSSIAKNPLRATDKLSQEVFLERYSSSTIKNFKNIITKLGYEVDVIPTTRELITRISKGGEMFKYDAVLNFSTGTIAPLRAGQAAILLDMLRVPYSGSDAQTLLVLRDKSLSKIIAKHVEVDVPEGCIFKEKIRYGSISIKKELYPLIIKPNFGCTGVGVSSNNILKRSEDLSIINKMLHKFPEGVIIEQFIPGMEITVFTVGNHIKGKVIPLILTQEDGRPTHHNYVLSGVKKYSRILTSEANWKLASNILPNDLISSIITITKRLMEGFSIRDYCRFDFRIHHESNKIFFIECNGQPSLEDKEKTICSIINSEYYKEENKLQYDLVETMLERMFNLNSRD